MQLCEKQITKLVCYLKLRVKKVQELVYKQGHAGITKAEVTVIFDNSNKE